MNGAAGAAAVQGPGSRVQGREDADPRLRDRGRWLAPLLVAGIAACCFAVLSLRAPVSSEVRYLEACREMAAPGGDWIVPHLGYVAYAEKPILLYWLGAIAQRLCGGSLVAMRLPSILAGAASLALAFAWARRWRGRAFAWTAATLLLGAGYFLGFGSILTTDTLFSAWLWLAWYAWWRREDGGGERWTFAMWAALGLAVLTKSPLALIISGLGIGLYLALTGQHRPLPRHWLARLAAMPWAVLAANHRRLRVVEGLVIVALVNLPWTLLAWARDPRLIEFLYVRENLKAFFDGSINHAQPPWYYAGVLCAALAPLTALALCALGSRLALLAPGLRSWMHGAAPLPPDRDARTRLLLLAMTIGALAFFQASSSKLASYLLPLVPPLVLLVADRLTTGGDGLGRWRRWTLGAQALVAALALAAAPIVIGTVPRASRALDRLDRAYLPLVGGAAALLVLGALIGGLLAWRGRIRAGAIATVIAAIVAALLVGPQVGAIRPDTNATRLAELIATRGGPDDLVVVGQNAVHDYTVQLRLGRRVAIIGNARELGLGHWLEVAPSGTWPAKPYEVSGATLPGHPWLYDLDRLAAAWGGPRRVWVVADAPLRAALRARGLTVHELGTAHDDLLLGDRP